MVSLYSDEYAVSLLRLFAALCVGGLIGLERTYNGRPAGFRTHSLVCMASALLMLLTVFQWKLLENVPIETLRIDPTRLAQGIMTGIGFLGAGVIMKESNNVKGLTTAASIWITAALGILIGMGFSIAAIIATVLTLGILSTFRILERRIPHLRSGRLTIEVMRKSHLNEDDILDIVKYFNISYTNRSYIMRDEGKRIRYEMTIQARDSQQFKMLADTLSQIDELSEFSISPYGK